MTGKDARTRVLPKNLGFFSEGATSVNRFMSLYYLVAI